MNRIPHVVIVGGGFGGLSAARALRRAPVRITLVDRRNHHLFQPLLYQVATAALSPADISAPIRGILRRQRNLEVRMAEVADVDTGSRQLVLADGSRLSYDFLVVATGATHAYFGHPEWAPLAPGLKTIEDATEIRRRFLLAFEAAEQEDDVEERRALLTFVVVGAGPTGVEMAGSMAEIARHAIVRDFRRIDPSTARILLIEGGPRVLPAYDPALSAYAERALARTGVEVRTGQVVTQINPEGVVVGGERIRSRNVVWAAGVAASPLGACLGGPTDGVGRVRVAPDLTVPGAPEVYAIGDLAAMDDARGRPLPGVAPVANQQGRHAAANILRTLAGEPRRPFRYVDKGSMATIGRSAAVMQVGRLRLKGLIAWLGWLFVHILVLIGFRNRVAVMMEWAYSYLTWQRGARLITGEVGPELAPPGRPIGSPEPGAGPAVEGPARHDAAPPEREAAGSLGGGRHRAPAPKP
jgi:NADH:ubiquinone reductase (H+-translocating)